MFSPCLCLGQNYVTDSVRYRLQHQPLDVVGPLFNNQPQNSKLLEFWGVDVCTPLIIISNKILPDGGINADLTYTFFVKVILRERSLIFKLFFVIK